MIRPWHPFNELSRLERNFGSLFNDLWRNFGSQVPVGSQFGGFPIDVLDEGENFVVRAELPGVEKDEIELQCTEDLLSIATEKSEKHEIKEDSWVRRESSFGKMVRTVSLDTTVDPSRVEASFKNGVLTITLPKTERTKRGHRIDIN